MSIEARLIQIDDSYQTNKLETCILSLCDRHPLNDSSWLNRRISKVGAGLTSALSKIPYIPIALKMGAVLGPICAFSNSVAFFTLEYWAAKALINDTLGAKTSAEQALFNKNVGARKKIFKTAGTLTAASIVALASQIPTMLAGIQYNKQPYKIPAGAVLLIAGALIPIRSLQLTFNKIQSKTQDSNEKNIAQIKERMSFLISTNLKKFIDASIEDKLFFIKKVDDVQEISSIRERVNQYVLTMTNQENFPVSEKKVLIGHLFNYTGLTLGVILAGLFEYALANYTFSTTKKELYDHNALSIPFTMLAVGSTAYLFGTSIIKTTQKIFNVFGNAVCKKEVKNIGWQLRPKLSFALTTIGFFINLFALGPTYVIWGDFYDKNKITHELFRNTMCASLFIILFTATLDIIDEIVLSIIKKGTEEEKKIISINREIHKLKEIIEKSPSNEFIKYLTETNDDFKEIILNRLNISSDEIAKYTT